MKTFFKNYHLPENLDVFFMLLFGIVLQVTDGSPFTMKERCMMVWETDLPSQYFSRFTEKLMKTVLSAIVVVRCATTYAYVVSGMLVIFCLIKKSAPKLLLLWLLIAGIKSVLMTFIEALIGVYVCSAFGRVRKACIEFFISKAIEIIFATYLWGSVLNKYHQMERNLESTRKKFEPADGPSILKLDARRQRPRSLLDESTLYKTACLNNFEFKDVPQIILQMLRRTDEMSQDSLLSPGMMLASVSNLGSFDSLKTSQSLGELGFVDLRSAQVLGLEEDETLSLQEKALKYLKLTYNDVMRAQINRSEIKNDIYKIDKNTWSKVVSGGTHINKPKEPRMEVFMRQIQPGELDEEPEVKKPHNTFDFKFSLSIFNIHSDKNTVLQTDEQDDESTTSSEIEEGMDEEESILMSNIRDEAVVNRIQMNFGNKKVKGNSYAQLYKENYMSIIGPEVFDKAPKLIRITSLSEVLHKFSARKSISSPIFSDRSKGLPKKIYFDDESGIVLTSSSNFHLSDLVYLKHAEEKIVDYNEQPTTSAKNKSILGENLLILKNEDTFIGNDNKKQLEIKLKPEKNHSKIRLLIKANESSRSQTDPEKPQPDDIREVSESLPCFRQRRIKIRRIGKRKLCVITLDSQNLFKNSTNSFGADSFLQTDQTPENDNNSPETVPPSQPSSHTSFEKSEKKISGGQNENIRLTDSFQKPILNLLMSYYELKQRSYLEKKNKLRSLKERKEFLLFLHKIHQVKLYKKLFHLMGLNQKNEKIWKSSVLKAAESASTQILSQIFKNFSTSQSKEILLKKLMQRYSSQIDFFKTKESRSNTESGRTESSEEEKKLLSEDTSEEESSFLFQICKVKPESDCSPKILSKIQSNHSSGSIKTISLENEITQLDGNCLKNQTLENSEALMKTELEQTSFNSQESDEPSSLYYSKAANLASPLLDMKTFIYPDHIHFSYKHVKKKGFDVDINKAFPFLMQENLTMTSPANVNKSDTMITDGAITRRPMDLSFISTFPGWQNNYSNEQTTKVLHSTSVKKKKSSEIIDKKTKRPFDDNTGNETRISARIRSNKTKCDGLNRNFQEIRHLYSSKDHLLVEKLLQMHARFNKKKSSESRASEKISSTQLHSNKGRVSSSYNPALFFHEKKSQNDKKKAETLKERTKDMLGRLETEAFLQSITFRSP